MASRANYEAWVQRWLQANQDAEKAGDWKPMAEFYTDDATYGWNIRPKEDVMCIGKAEIRDVALSEGMITLRRAALLNAMRGKTTIEEVLRVTRD